MDNKKIILILVILIVVLASVLSLMLVNSYKEVDSQYVYAPTLNEKVKFTGTYLGPYGGMYNLNGASGVMQVGNAYAIVSTDKLQGMEGQEVTVEGYFVNLETETVSINNNFVSGKSFCIENVV